MVKLTVVGCSPAWPNPGGAQSGYLVEGSGRLLLDCGPGVLPRLREQDGWPRVDAIVITHFHLDHWGDLVPWTFGAMFGPGRETPKPELWLPPHGLAELEQFGVKFGVPGMFSEGFDAREYKEDEPFETCGLTVTPLRVPHYQLETYALRVSDGVSTLAYSGDSAPSPQLAEVGRDADLFLCEATLRESVEGGNGLRGHLSAEEAVAAFHDSGAKRLVIIHRPDELPLDDGIERASDGDSYVF
jgi:ribonuclease BN (tRNA processing enzyme)